MDVILFENNLRLKWHIHHCALTSFLNEQRIRFLLAYPVQHYIRLTAFFPGQPG